MFLFTDLAWGKRRCKNRAEGSEGGEGHGRERGQGWDGEGRGQQAI